MIKDSRRDTLPVKPHVRALTLLIQLWRYYDSAGISIGRSREAILLELAMELLGDHDPNELAKLDDQFGNIVGETRDYLSALRLKKYNEKWLEDDDEKL